MVFVVLCSVFHHYGRLIIMVLLYSMKYYLPDHFRRNNGQPLMCDMAVIIQEQVSGPGVAGVAFSRDPNTGDPGKITVAASYGLEKAVSLTTKPYA